MTEDGKPLETLLEDAARARRLAIVLDGDPAALELERYAEEVEAEIRRRSAGDRGQYLPAMANSPITLVQVAAYTEVLLPPVAGAA